MRAPLFRGARRGAGVGLDISQAATQLAAAAGILPNAPVGADQR